MPFAAKSMISIMVAGVADVPVGTVAKVLEAWDKVVLSQLNQGAQVRLLGCGILQVKLRAPRRKRLPGGAAFIAPAKRVIVLTPTVDFETKVRGG